jgi:hypothetical protein
VLPRSQLIFSFQNLVFWGIYLNFQQQKSRFKFNTSHLLNPNLTK